ncbi:hypothetical protein EHYA_05262 [Embleya hyalina]|uniref:DUF8094 domain-containing protein n=1 Tax=Embleya hyalina TaxID=516124 RepID=A0A401YSH2_9ACTN|nr:hypothetical protein EHYA_05262 [Embleya hyalina]
MARPTNTQLPATLLAALATLTLLTTACSSDNKSKTPKISQAAPKTAAAPLPPPPASPRSPAPTAPPISEGEAKTIAQNYYDASKKTKSAHDISGLDQLETGTLLDISRARQQRIVKFGNKIQLAEEAAATGDIQVATPQGSPDGTDRWLLSIGTQKLGNDSRSSLGVLRQAQGTGPWKMSFLAFGEVKKSLPGVTQMAILDDNSGIDYGDNTCKEFASGLTGGSTTITWGSSAQKAIQTEQANKQGLIGVTKGGNVSVRTEALVDNHVPAWKTTDGQKLVMCSVKLTSTMTAGPSGKFNVDQSATYENLSGRVTTWRSLEITNIGMYVFKVPASGNGSADLVASAGRPFSVDGTSV